MTVGGRDQASHERVLHDLRTPLSVIKGSVDVLRRHWNDLDQDRRTELLERALVNVEDLAATIDEVHGPSDEGVGRVRLEEIELARTRTGPRAQVVLSVDGAVRRGEGRAEGPGKAPSAVVEATLDALRSVVGAGVIVEEVDVVSCGEEQVAAVVLSWGGRRLAGSALAGFDEAGALCRATLHALNRAVGA
jgi:signal transduction histidine kinase